MAVDESLLIVFLSWVPRISRPRPPLNRFPVAHHGVCGIGWINSASIGAGSPLGASLVRAQDVPCVTVDLSLIPGPADQPSP